jgi:hypothetical protein
VVVVVVVVAAAACLSILHNIRLQSQLGTNLYLAHHYKLRASVVHGLYRTGT